MAKKTNEKVTSIADHQKAKAGSKPASGSGKGSDAKDTAATAEQVYRVAGTGGPIETIDRAKAVEDCTAGGMFNAESVDGMLDGGDVAFSDDFYYATDPKLLSKWEQSGSSQAETIEPAPEDDATAALVDAEVEAAAGSSEYPATYPTFEAVKNIVTQATGTIVDRKGSLAVETAKVKGGTKLVDLTEAWEKVETPLADVKPDAIVKKETEEIAKPLTKKEQTRLEKLEAAVIQAKDAIENGPFVMAAALDEIRKDRLYRDTHKRFGDYAFEKFGITREYAQQLAQIAGYVEIANEALEGDTKLNTSVNVAIALTRDTNKLAKELGLGRVEMAVLKPLIVSTVTLLADIAPKDEDGNLIVTPRLVDALNTTIREHITDGVVEIEGDQMTLGAAKEKGLLNHSLREEVITRAAEGLRVNSERIAGEVREAYDRQNEPVGNGGENLTPDKPTYWTKPAPTPSFDCSLHGNKPIISIGNGRFQTKCLCRWHIDADSGELVCFEVKGKRVRRAA